MNKTMIKLTLLVLVLSHRNNPLGKKTAGDAFVLYRIQITLSTSSGAISWSTMGQLDSKLQRSWVFLSQYSPLCNPSATLINKSLLKVITSLNII